VCMCVAVCMYVLGCRFVFLYGCIFTCASTYVCIYMCVYVCVYTRMYVHIHRGVTGTVLLILVVTPSVVDPTFAGLWSFIRALPGRLCRCIRRMAPRCGLDSIAVVCIGALSCVVQSQS
jgi:hypothetical protein